MSEIDRKVADVELLIDAAEGYISQCGELDEFGRNVQAAIARIKAGQPVKIGPDPIVPAPSRDFGQRVMAAAGVEPTQYRWVVGNDNESCFTDYHQSACIKWRDEHLDYCKSRGFDVIPWAFYPQWQTPEGFCALWDALEARGWLILFGGGCVQVDTKIRLRSVRFLCPSAGVSTNGVTIPNRAAALLEAAAQALVVKP